MMTFQLERLIYSTRDLIFQSCYINTGLTSDFIGGPIDLPRVGLPSKRDVLKYVLYTRNLLHRGMESGKPLNSHVYNAVARILLQLYRDYNFAAITQRSIASWSNKTLQHANWLMCHV